MNILHISPYLPSVKTNHAGGVCMGKHIETLKEKHKVYVLTFIASEFDRGLSKEYREDQHYKFVTITKWTKGLHVILEPFLPNYFAARTSFRFMIRMIYLIKKHQIDVIHAEYASMGQYLWIKKVYPGVRFYMTEHDVTAQSYERKMKETLGLRRRYLEFQYKQILRCEGKYCRRADGLFAFNQKDKELIQRYYKVSDINVLNPYYGLEDCDVQETIQRKWKPEYARICFMGQMGRDENFMAAMRLIEIGKRVCKSIPELQIYIVGNNPPRSLQEQANDYIHITGYVDDVDEYLVRSQLAVFPLTLGAGIKLKVLRSLALGTPVITGRLGAEGIDEQGDVIILAESDEEYIDKIIRFITVPEECIKLGEKSKSYIIDNFSWSKSEKVLNDVYQV